MYSSNDTMEVSSLCILVMTQCRSTVLCIYVMTQCRSTVYVYK